MTRWQAPAAPHILPKSRYLLLKFTEILVPCYANRKLALQEFGLTTDMCPLTNEGLLEDNRTAKIYPLLAVRRESKP